MQTSAKLLRDFLSKVHDDEDADNMSLLGSLYKTFDDDLDEVTMCQLLELDAFEVSTALLGRHF